MPYDDMELGLRMEEKLNEQNPKINLSVIKLIKGFTIETLHGPDRYVDPFAGYEGAG